jgi:5-methylcytosine-specific restriction endonuclease McrBC regulatory subunit McrC
MNQLFEAFVINFIWRHRKDVLPQEFRNCDLLPQSCGINNYLARTEQKLVFLLKPDLAFRDKAGQLPLLLDAKHKRLDKADPKLGVSQSDFYQMHAYARCYDGGRIVLLYPRRRRCTNPCVRSSRSKAGAKSARPPPTCELIYPSPAGVARWPKNCENFGR